MSKQREKGGRENGTEGEREGQREGAREGRGMGGRGGEEVQVIGTRVNPSKVTHSFSIFLLLAVS